MAQNSQKKTKIVQNKFSLYSTNISSSHKISNFTMHFVYLKAGLFVSMLNNIK